MNKPWLSSLATVARQLNAAIDAGHLAAISLDEVYRELKSGDLVQFLAQRLPGAEFPREEQGSAVNEVLAMIAGGIEGHDRKMTSVERSGVCLVVALCIEAMQQREWSVPSPGAGRGTALTEDALYDGAVSTYRALLAAVDATGKEPDRRRSAISRELVVLRAANGETIECFDVVIEHGRIRFSPRPLDTDRFFAGS